MVFKQGQSGNPNGRPKGTRHKPIEILFKIFAENEELFTQEAREKMKQDPLKFYKFFIEPLVPKDVKLLDGEGNDFVFNVRRVLSDDEKRLIELNKPKQLKGK